MRAFIWVITVEGSDPQEIEVFAFYSMIDTQDCVDEQKLKYPDHTVLWHQVEVK